MAIDVIFLIVFTYCFYVGYNRGIIRTVFVFASIIIGFVAAAKFTSEMRTILESTFNISPAILPLVAFLLTFLLAMLLIRLLANFVEGIVDAVNLDLINHIAGGVLFCALGVLVYSSVLNFVDEARLLSDQVIKDSTFYIYLKAFPNQFSEVCSGFLPFVSDAWESMMKLFEGLEQDMRQPTN